MSKLRGWFRYIVDETKGIADECMARAKVETQRLSW